MTAAKIGINGGGRIGRVVIRQVLQALQKGDNSVHILAVNDLMISPEYMAYLIKYDTTHGVLSLECKAVGDMVIIGDLMKFKVIKEGDPSKISWAQLGVDYVIESTGRFTKHEQAKMHLQGGAKKVIIMDGPSAKDWRAGRAASVNIIPASTGAAKAVGKVIPALQGKLTGKALRAPVINVSVVDLTVVVEKPATKQQIDNAIKAAADGPMKGIIQFIDAEVVSSDFNGCPYSCSYDSSAMVTFDPSTPQSMFQLCGWYDNETGYSARMVDLIKFMHSKH
ncbi:hypothetical protein MXB_3667 [Myxobolus squamalis]|nr:hypothetical protein MXB_3667 [Myxobolus squamalis]